jgi:5-formyltetrahydrofolate cyclo-ligase
VNRGRASSFNYFGWGNHTVKLDIPKLYGLAFDCQEVGSLDVKPWDVQLDGVITPTKIIK